MNQRNPFSQQGHFRCFSQQGTGEGQEAHRLPAKSRRERLQKGKAAMLRRDRNAHRNGAQHMPQSVDGNYEEETKADTPQGGEDWLDANLANDIDEQ